MPIRTQSAKSVRSTINQLAPGTPPLYRVRTMDEAIRRTDRDQRLQATLMTGFSVVSLLLAAVGIYGLLKDARLEPVEVLRQQQSASEPLAFFLFQNELSEAA